MNVLYISYDGVLEPLGESQVLQYLFKLAPLHQITLLSFEKASDWSKREHRKKISWQINKAGIRWVPLRYHKYPLFFSTFYDLVIGFLAAFYLKIRHRISIIHTRSYVPALLGLSLKAIFGIRFIFDMRGFWADEKVDAGIWSKGSLIYKVTKRLEVLYFKKADCLVSLTNAGVNELLKFSCFDKNRTVIKVIPTCVNMQLFKPAGAVSHHDAKTFILGYTGTVTGWYLFDPVLDCFKLLSKIMPRVNLSIFNKNEHAYIRDAFEKSGMTDASYNLNTAEYSQMPANINKFDAGIYFIKPVFSKLASVPTKLGEFLACGVPCLTNSGVGDTQNILEGEGVGAVLTDFSLQSKETAVKELLALCADKSIRQRCVDTAKKYFSLDMGANAYNQLYLNKY